MEKNKKVLIISSHADDHIRCAGTLLKLKAERNIFPFEIVFTDSSRGQDFRSDKLAYCDDVRDMRHNELSKASQFLGMQETFLFHQKDFGLLYSHDLVFKTAKIIRSVKPEIMIINDSYDFHPDHKQSYQIAIDAIKLSAMDVEIQNLGKAYRVPLILCVEMMLPNKTQMLVDITNYYEKKKQLLGLYTSQMSQDLLAYEEGMLASRGYYIKNGSGVYAEAYTLQNEFPILLFENDLL